MQKKQKRETIFWKTEYLIGKKIIKSGIKAMVAFRNHLTFLGDEPP